MNDGDEAGVRALYEATYPRLVASVRVVAGNRHDAEEAVQEAFVRLLPRWSRVRTYDDPEAWVRLVAFRVCSSRRRKAANGVRAALRLGPPPDVPGPAEPATDLERALAGLSAEHRVVLVLHHVHDWPLERIAAELGVPVGTVKSRLSRAREAARGHLEEEHHDH